MKDFSKNRLRRLTAILLIIFAVFFISSCRSELQKASKNLTTYTITASYDEYTQTITAFQKVKYVNNNEVPLDELKFHLYPNAFRQGAKIKPISQRESLVQKAYPNGESYGDIIINKVFVSGKESDFTIGGEDRNIMTVKFPMELYPEACFTIEFDFVLRLANTPHRLGYTDKCVNLGNWYPIACVYKNGDFVTYAYYANGDPFFSEAANYNVELTLNSDFFVASSGRNVGTVLSGNTKTLKYEALAVRDFAFVLSKQFSTISATAGNISVTYFYYDDLEAGTSLKAAVDAVNTFTAMFGSLPYSHLNVVKTPFIYGGMEYPNLIYISDSIADRDAYLETIIHEAAHQWWYSAVGNDQVRDAWQDEGLTEYTTTLFYEKNPSYGQTHADRIMQTMQAYLVFIELFKSVHGEIDTSMNRPSYAYKNDYEYEYMTYVKGELMFANIRNIIGDNDFFGSLKKYYNRSKYKVTVPKDLIGAFEDTSKKDLEGIFDAWLQGKVVLGDW